MKFKLLFLPISLVVALFMFVYFTKPAWDGYQGNKKDLAKNEQDLRAIQNSKQSLDNSLGVFKEVDIDKKFLLSNAIPTSLQEENFLRELNNIALDSGVRVVEISLRSVDDFEKIQDLQENNGIETTKAEVSLNGDYPNLRKALSSLENTNRFINVEEFLFKEETQLENLNLGIDLAFFHKKDNEFKFSFDDSYFKKLLKNGLALEVIDEYMLKREKVINFSSLNLGDLGTDNLFEFSGSGSGTEEAVAEGVLNESTLDEATGTEQANVE